MTATDQSQPQPVEPTLPPHVKAAVDPSASQQRTAPALRSHVVWAARFVSQPLLFFAAGAALLGLLGLAQKTGWISAGGAGTGRRAAVTAAEVDYICPMMCTPPQQEPGRCPVCAMELVPASSGSGGGDGRSIVVDPASRRVANIQTVSVRSAATTRIIHAVGELHYDESRLKTISAYTDGRFDQLYVDFTGAVVHKGERLASFYSPELYSAQVEYLQAGETVSKQSAQSLASVAEANRRLHTNSRQRLVELGTSPAQLEELDESRQAQSRMDVVAPMSGTVIEKLVVEGDYVKEGQPVFRLADLSRVWLMLQLFPEDAASIRVGQSVEAVVKSLPGRSMMGEVTFIDPSVDARSRTVSVRVVIENHDGQLRVGDYAKAHIAVPVGGVAEWGTSEPQNPPGARVVPRSAVLMAAGESVVYVETEPGRFEIRRVVTGATVGDDIVIIKGLVEGEAVATGGNFLIDSQMQLAGNPSLIDPTRAAPPLEMTPGFDAEMLAAIRQLPEEDQPLALEQVVCPVTDFKLGSMGVPPKVVIDGKPVFLCCDGCRDSLLEDPQAHLGHLREQADDATTSSTTGELSLPPLGRIQEISSAPELPPIGSIESLTPLDDSQNHEKLGSADSDADAGRITQ